MKNRLVQLYLAIAKIDRRYLQLAYFAVVLSMFILQAPTDGGGGVR